MLDLSCALARATSSSVTSDVSFTISVHTRGISSPRAAITESGIAKGTPIAISEFYGSSAIAQQRGREIAEVVSADLERSGLFRPLDRRAFIQSADELRGLPRFADWRQINAQALVNGKSELGDDGRLRVEFRLWDVFAEQQLVGMALVTWPQGWRRVAHKVADAVYKRITGEDGYFDTRIVYIAESGPQDRRTTRLSIMDQDGANHRFLTDGANLVLTPRFHPDAARVAYMVYRGRVPQVYLRPVEGGQRGGVAVGVHITGGMEESAVAGNDFIANGTQVRFNQREPIAWGTGEAGNHWSDYLGWDLDGDAIGDRAYHAAGTMDRLLFRYPQLKALASSPVVALMQALESRFPVLRPPSVVDRRPAVGDWGSGIIVWSLDSGLAELAESYPFPKERRARKRDLALPDEQQHDDERDVGRCVDDEAQPWAAEQQDAAHADHRQDQTGETLSCQVQHRRRARGRRGSPSSASRTRSPVRARARTR